MFSYTFLIYPDLSEAITCDQFLKKDSSKVQTIRKAQPEINFTQAQRLLSFLEQLSPEQRSDIYKNLADADFNEITNQIKEGNTPDYIKDFQAKAPGSGQILADFMSFGDAFPGVFALSQTILDKTIMNFLKASRNEEINGVAKHQDFLNNKSRANRLLRTVTNTLTHFIQQGDLENDGHHFTDSKWKKIAAKFGRFFHPNYYKSISVIEQVQLYQKQIERIPMVDNLFIRHALTIATTKKDADNIFEHVKNSSGEINTVVKELKYIFGEQHDVESTIWKGQFDISASAKRAKSSNKDALSESFDVENLKSLRAFSAFMKERFSEKRKDRTLKDYFKDELSLYYGIFNRRISHYKDLYLGITSEISNETYTVEESYTVTYQSGTDSKGNPTYSTRTEYRDENVKPSFENILSNKYDLGDRGVWGLKPIKQRAAEQVAIEAPKRALISSVQDTYYHIINNHPKAIGNPEVKAEHIKSIDKKITELNLMIEKQKKEMKKPSRYINDNSSNHKRRNKKMYQRLINAKELLEVTKEFYNRNALQFKPVFDLYDFTPWLQKQNSVRWWTHAKQTVSVLAPTGTTAAYVTIPEFQQWADPKLNAVSDKINEVIIYIDVHFVSQVTELFQMMAN